MSVASALRVGLIGYGAIGRSVSEHIHTGNAGVATLGAVLCRDVTKHDQNEAVKAGIACFTDNPDEFFATGPNVIIEAAGQDALREHGKRSLEIGSELIVSSIGAFADDDYFAEMLAHAGRSGGRLRLVSGALPAVDWMSAASITGVNRVSITQSKPVASWRGTAAEQLLDLDALDIPTCFFEGTAGQAASQFPKSSNITAMLALCTAGMNATAVKLVADPGERRMVTLIEYEGEAGSLKIEWRGVPSRFNASTSADVPLTIVRMLKNLSGPVSYGA
jgi:aspartate dehydrogenase